MAKSQEKVIALKLRRGGMSIRNIASRLNISKSSASSWCSGIKLTEKQRRKLIENAIKNGAKGRLIGAAWNKKKKQDAIVYYRDKARKQLNNLTKQAILASGTALYWAEGAKTDNTSGFSFMNSDPRMILFMKNFLISTMGIKKENISCTIQINRVHEVRISKVLKFWSSLLKLPMKQFRKPYYVNVKHRKVYENHDIYYGTLRLKVEKSSTLKYHMLGLINALNVGVAQLVRAQHS